MSLKFPHYRQHDQMDCGPTCLRMVAKHHGRSYTLQHLRGLCNITKQGVSLLAISEAAEKIGFRTSSVKITLEQLKEIELPCILHWKQNHFVVFYRRKKGQYYIADPASQLLTYPEKEFISHWVGNKDNLGGVALIISPTPFFYEEYHGEPKKAGWSFLLRYRYNHSKLILQLFLGLGVGTLLQVITPFLTQSVVDIGINTGNLNFIYLILIAQVMLFFGTMSVNFLRSWIMLHISTRINVSILTDFLAKLMRLPMSFFDTRMTGDIMQRMADHKRLEAFLTGTTLSTLFSMINLLVFTIVLAHYNSHILMIFLISAVLYAAWIIIFMKKRRELDFRRFDQGSMSQSNMVELISGIHEIKLHNSEQQKRWQWERIQANLFTFSIKSLALSQYQQAGSMFVNQGKNILISFISAKAVIDGDLTLGGMMAVQFIVGQLNSPIEQLLGLIHGFQDAKISLERLNEVHQMEDEEASSRHWHMKLPEDKSIHISNLTFRYPGADNEPVLNGISFVIPQGNITAIVGTSGSGKTTILKLLLRFYQLEKGHVKIDNLNLADISFKVWRGHCGIVMQDGFIFSDTIANNIAVGDDNPDWKRIEYAVQIANIREFIEGLQLGLNTRIGSGGNGISQGQKQRILIARAVYKNPEYLIFDEATNALDSNNEEIILGNLRAFLKGKTVIVVAHRVSTVKNADNIIVLDKGKIIEQGTHSELTCLRGAYYNLVKNQLEMAK